MSLTKPTFGKRSATPPATNVPIGRLMSQRHRSVDPRVAAVVAIAVFAIGAFYPAVLFAGLLGTLLGSAKPSAGNFKHTPSGAHSPSVNAPLKAAPSESVVRGGFGSTAAGPAVDSGG